MIIRDYIKKDIPKIREVIKKSLDSVVLNYYSSKITDAIYDYYDEGKINEFERVIVSEEEGEIRGCVSFSGNEIKMLYPDPEFKKRAYVAIMLLEYSKEQIRNKGYTHVVGQALESSKNFLSRQAELGTPYMEKINGVEFKVTPMSIKL